MAKPNQTHEWAVKSEPEPKQFLMIVAEAEAKNYYMMEAKAEPEIGVPVTKP